MTRYFADNARHLVAVPYSRDALLAMADDLDIPHHWFHSSNGRLAHIDIPKRLEAHILADPRVTIVSPRDIVAITKGIAFPNARQALRFMHSNGTWEDAE